MEALNLLSCREKEALILVFTLKSEALECQMCRTGPKPHSADYHMYLCGAGGVVCRSCLFTHKSFCGASHSSECCRYLEEIASRIIVECACGLYAPYSLLKKHRGDCFTVSKLCASAWRGCRKCMLKAELVCCSMKSCGARLRPPVFKQRCNGFLVCPDCRHAAHPAEEFDSCPDVDYLLKCMMVDVQVPRISPCDDGANSAVAVSNIIIGKTNGKAPSKVGKTGKHIVERCELETGKRVASSNTSFFHKKENIATTSGNKRGKRKGEARLKVHKMDDRIVDNDAVESDDDSSDDIHSGTGKCVSAYNKKAKLATPSGGQKTGDMMGAPELMLHPAHN